MNNIKHKSIAFFDIDGTIYSNHSFLEMIKEGTDNGLFSKSTWLAILEDLALYKSGHQDYSTTAEKLINIWVKDLKGLEYKTAYDLSVRFFENHREHFYPYFEQILPKLKETHQVYLVTTNTQFVAEAIVKLFELDGYISTVFEVKNGKFTGEILSSLAEGKDIVETLINKDNFDRSIACGDSENDIMMLNKVKYPVCMNPDKELRNFAEINDWVITNPEEATEAFYKILG